MPTLFFFHLIHSSFTHLHSSPLLTSPYLSLFVNPLFTHFHSSPLFISPYSPSLLAFPLFFYSFLLFPISYPTLFFLTHHPSRSSTPIHPAHFHTLPYLAPLQITLPYSRVFHDPLSFPLNFTFHLT